MSRPDLTIPLARTAVWSQDPLPGPPLAGFLNAASGIPDTTFIEPLLRRRLGPLGRGMLHCAARAAGDIPELRSVFASRHGEPSRTMPMLEDLTQGLDISPTQFSMNVHNAVAGIWSISRRDRSASTALGAGSESFGWGLVEAYSLHRAHGGAPVLFVYGDDRLPEALTAYEPLQAPLHAVAFLIAAPGVRHLRLHRDPFAEGPATEASQSLHGLRALEDERTSPWMGPSGAWVWHLE